MWHLSSRLTLLDDYSEENESYYGLSGSDDENLEEDDYDDEEDFPSDFSEDDWVQTGQGPVGFARERHRFLGNYLPLINRQTLRCNEANAFHHHRPTGQSPPTTINAQNSPFATNMASANTATAFFNSQGQLVARPNAAPQSRSDASRINGIRLRAPDASAANNQRTFNNQRPPSNASPGNNSAHYPLFDGNTFPTTNNDRNGDDDDGDGGQETRSCWETSSIESQNMPNFWSRPSTANDSTHEAAGLDQVERCLSRLGVNQLNKLLSTWSLKKSGRKAVLVKRLIDHIAPTIDNPSQFNELMETCNRINAESPGGSRMGGRNVFAYLSDPAFTEELLAKSAPYDFDYSLPLPWVLEAKLTPPIVCSFVSRDRHKSIRIDFKATGPPGSKYLLVAIKLYRDSESKELLNYQDKLNRPRYRHAYIKSFSCQISNTFYTASMYGVSKVHEITDRIVGHENNYINFSIQDHAGRDYMFQIVQARKDFSHWKDFLAELPVKQASQVWRQLQRDFGPSAHEISTPAIAVRMICPLLLIPLKTPLRSNRCKHPQCFDKESWLSSFRNLASNITNPDQLIFTCPVCEAKCKPDSIFVDGLMREIIEQTRASEVILDLEKAAWRIPSELSPETQRPSKRSKIDLDITDEPEIIDLTTTPDSPVDPSEDSILVKPDPGANEQSASRTDRREKLATDPIMIDPNSDVITLPLLNDRRPNSRVQRKGSSIGDAIVID